jgi:Fe-S-cluster containining protein
MPEHGDQTAAPIPCFRCGVCCVKWQPLLGPPEIRRLSDELGVTTRTFKRRYTRPYPLRRGWHQLLDSGAGCVFLSWEDGVSGCSIHAVRPQVCRDWQAGLDRRECLQGLRDLPGPALLTIERLFSDATGRGLFVAAAGAGEVEASSAPD